MNLKKMNMKLEKSNRSINKIILHATATPEGREHDVEDITRWHRARGFSTIGYHYLIKLDGTIELGRNVQDMGAHVYGQNRRSIGVVYVGGMNKSKTKAKDTRTEAQKEAMEGLIIDLLALYPNATVHGHNEFAEKACPCFDVQKEYGYIWNPEIEELTTKEEENEE